MVKKYHTEEELKEAKKIWSKTYYEKNKDSCKKRKKTYRHKKKSAYDNMKSEQGCLFCNESDSRCLDFHHKNKNDKKCEVSVLIRNDAAESTIMSEIKKCVILCANCHRKLHSCNYENVVYKGWGYEIWIVNKEYCGKILGVKKGKKCSYHYHAIKEETFYLAKGKIIVRYGQSDNIEEAENILMTPGMAFHIPVGLRHQFEALENSEIIEFSTHHEDSDSLRVIQGD